MLQKKHRLYVANHGKFNSHRRLKVTNKANHLIRFFVKKTRETFTVVPSLLFIFLIFTESVDFLFIISLLIQASLFLLQFRK